MLTIRKAQMQVLGAYMKQGFEDRMVRHIAVTFPSQFKQLAAEAQNYLAVRKFIQSGIEKARRYGIEAEPDVATYIELMVIHGPDFERGPAMAPARRFLEDPNLRGRDKVFGVQDFVTRLARAESR